MKLRVHAYEQLSGVITMVNKTIGWYIETFKRDETDYKSSLHIIFSPKSMVNEVNHFLAVPAYRDSLVTRALHLSHKSSQRNSDPINRPQGPNDPKGK